MRYRSETILDNENFIASVQQQIAGLPDDARFIDLLLPGFYDDNTLSQELTDKWSMYYKSLPSKQKSQITRLFRALSMASSPKNRTDRAIGVIYTTDTDAEPKWNTLGTFRHITVERFQNDFVCDERHGLDYNSIGFLIDIGLFKTPDEDD